MGRSPCCSKEGMNKGAWTAHEDKTLIEYIKTHGEGRWRNLPKKAGLKRCGKSCRLRWLNYLRPDIKRGNISQDEEELIIETSQTLRKQMVFDSRETSRRTDNEIKNYWNTNLSKKVQESLSNKVGNNNNNTNLGKKVRESLSIHNINHRKKSHFVRMDHSESLPEKKSSSFVPVVRTKATKCTKAVVIDSNLHVKPIGQQGDNNSMDNEMNKTDSTLSNYGSSSFDTNKNINDFALDFDLDGEFCSNDLLDFDFDFDFSDFVDFGHEKNILTSTGQQPIVISEEMLQDWSATKGGSNDINSCLI